MNYRETTVVITGASSGLGEQFAVELAKRGADLVLVARRVDRLEASAARLHAEHGVRVTPLSVDLAHGGAAVAIRAALDERHIAVTTLINCAGVGATGSFVRAGAVSVADQIAVNVSALVEITHALLPDIVAAGRGAVINVASLSGYQPAPNMAVYGATKAFVLSFTEALSVEMAATDVRILCLSPGPTRTEFYAVSGTSESGTRFQTPEQVVATALRALDRQRTPASVVSGRTNRLIAGASHLLPRRLVLALSARAVQPA